ncbi:MAG: TonB-dependent receptor [Bacteroidetes bacterium]|nr:MAG: TonB-dependent receptor [Bacteroidota bacterium]
MKRNFLFVAAAFFGSQLTAQQDTTVKAMDELVITANKYPNKTSLTGKVLTIISREQLERSGGKDLAQILTEQAGVYIGGANSNPGKDKSIYLRGARIDHTLITIDGVPVYDPSGIGGNFDIRNLSAANIERIEILKGSQSTLYGSDAIAGVINIITKKAGNKAMNGNAMLGYGSFNSFRGSAGINGQKEKFDYNLNYSIHKTDGINESTSNSSNADKDGYTQHNIMAGFGIQPSKNIRIQPYIRFSKIDGDLDQGAFVDELDYTYNQESFQAGVRNEFSFGKTKLNILYNYNTIDREYIDDSIKSQNGFDTYSRGMYKGNEHFIDAYAHFSINDKIKLTTGVDFRSSVSDQEYLSIGFYGPYKTKYSSDSLNQNQLGLYAAMNFNSSCGFNIELGNRLNIHSEYGSYDVFNINPSYLINKRFKLFANFSSAYRTPSLYQLFSEYGNKDLDPESGYTLEGGMQFFSNDKKFTSRAVAFKRDVKDVIFFYYNASTFQSQYINQDKQKDNGIELEASYTIAKNTTIKAFYTYVTGEITTKKSSGKDTTFFNLLRRPKNSFGVNISSQVNEKLFVSSNLSAFGERSDRYFDSNTFQTVNATLKSYALWDVYAEYGFSKNKIKLFADLRNILDSKYTEISGFNTTGFAINGGVRLNF